MHVHVPTGVDDEDESDTRHMGCEDGHKLHGMDP
jgi:hypothetical protein